MKETFAVGADTKTGDAGIDDFWFPENFWPAEVVGLEAVVTEYLSLMTRAGSGAG